VRVTARVTQRRSHIGLIRDPEEREPTRKVAGGVADSIPVAVPAGSVELAGGVEGGADEAEEASGAALACFRGAYVAEVVVEDTTAVWAERTITVPCMDGWTWHV
jgi:hypothetical protein